MIDKTVAYKKFKRRWVAYDHDGGLVSTGQGPEEAIVKAKAKGVASPVVSKIPAAPGARFF